ncbi:MAG TPA: AAA family ATPase [Rhizomicrobium sp.]
MNRDNFHIFTGGPGVGKTTLLEALRRRGYRGVDEVARQVLAEQAAMGGNATHGGDRARYRDLMLAKALRAYRAVTETAAPVFFDRGIPELSGYGNAPGEPDPPALTAAIAECRYAKTVFLFPPWREIYVHDDLRKHDFAEAVATYEFMAAIYPRHGYRIVEVPRASVDARAAFVLERIGEA